MSNLRFSWFGPPIIERNQAVVRLETRKATALLAFVGLAPSPPSRESLAALFWPEFDPAHALANLRRALFAINDGLGPGVITGNRETIGIDPHAPVWQDAREFRRLLEAVKAHPHADISACPECIETLETAAALYRGDFLEGVNLRDCPEFDDWQYLQRENYRHELASALEKLAQAYTGLEDWEKAIREARQWVCLDRLNENAQRMLMQAYAQSGQRSAALTQYEECARWLQDELGGTPEEETSTLYEKIRAGEIGKTVKTAKTTTAPPLGRSANQPLIKTKLFVPRLPAKSINRPQLFEKLERGAQCDLTLISAPAGYGKTTLLAEWIETRRKNRTSTPWTVGWLSLDAEDNDPIRFLTYLTAALGNVNPGIGVEAQSLLQSAHTLQPQTPLSILINDLQELPQSVTLVLDDYQFISNPTIHEGIVFLIEHLPHNVHLVIATRSDPPLPFARLRGRNQLSEIRAKDLRFSAGEASAFLKDAFNLALTPEQITVLENRTEGWIAGIQMAAISMQGRGDIASFIEAFSGSHRFIMDYLTEEALNRQPAETQEFLLQTSILERLSEPLCDYVLDRTGKSGSQPGNPSLRELERSNLFVVPLDDERTWYRYHHLFADLLRTRLEQVSPEQIAHLHVRASEWFEKMGGTEEAIHHALAAKDWSYASRLIEHHMYRYLENGQLATIMKWINSLPKEIIYQNPKLCVRVAEVYVHAGLIDQTEPLLLQAEEKLAGWKGQQVVPQGLDLNRRDAGWILTMIAMIRGLKSVFAGDPNRALSLTQSALKTIPEIEPRELAWLHWVEGWAYRHLGNLEHALRLFKKATEYADEAGMILRDIWTDLGITYRMLGQLPQAIDIFTNSLQTAAQRGAQNQGNLSRDEALLSIILLEQNRLDLALEHANRAVAYTQWWPSHNHITIAYASLAIALLARGDTEGAMGIIQKADQEQRNRLVVPYNHILVIVVYARIWLAQGKWDMLEEWTQKAVAMFQNTVKDDGPFDEYMEMSLIMLVRIWMGQTRVDQKTDRYEDCLGLLKRLETNAQNAGRTSALIEIMILKESLRFILGERSEAVQGLSRCLALAEPGGFIRVFLTTGEPTYALLKAYLQQGDPSYQGYVLKILKVFGQFAQSEGTVEEFAEPITSREMEVLRLVAKGYSNRQMAEALMLSEGTIKFHVHNLLEKLQVDSRTRAIARANELGLM